MASTTCPECQTRYYPSIACDRRHHAVHHDEFRYGVRLRRLDRFEHVGRIDSLDVLLVRPDSDIFARRRAERVARRSIREPLGEGGYDSPTYFAEDPYQVVPSLAAHVLILAQGSRGIGILLSERRLTDARYDWSEAEKGYVRTEMADASMRWSIAHIWIMSSYRRRGLGQRLLEMALAGLGTDGTRALWVTPFSAGGHALVRKFAGLAFWHAGDPPPHETSYVPPFRSPNSLAG